ncbi:hypothetical protein DFH07DRAFT_981141 [Mycena maculata]|uniref:Uncharacterized protein n=1 Tax=Mycena maculata TaxID=230809 RepID=A0AAD7IF93_9AGAR|nr:hypothetical protein DFH07DRAFT_981141 [Mycena maculata]
MAGVSNATSRPVSLSLPPYSANLHLGEQLLGQTLRNRTTGDYVRRCGRLTLALHGQELGAEIATYGREARVTGVIILAESETVTNVVLQVRGKMDTTVADLGCLTTRTLRKTFTVWPTESKRPICPSTLPFSLLLLATFRDDNHVWYDLPPSYDIDFPGFFGTSAYHFLVVITKFQFLPSDQMKDVSSVSIYSAVTNTTSTRRFEHSVSKRTGMAKIITRLAVASQGVAETLELGAQAFNMEDPIPFHIRLTGAIPLVQHCRTDFTRVIGIGHGSPGPCYPPLTGTSQSHDEIALAWEGKLRCNPDVHCGGFDAGLMKIQDSVVVEMTPSQSHALQVGYLRHTERITLAPSAMPRNQ